MFYFMNKVIFLMVIFFNYFICISSSPNHESILLQLYLIPKDNLSSPETGNSLEFFLIYNGTIT